MASQVLALHRVSPRCFDLSRVRTGSVRDQLLRSTVVVNALVDDGLIGVGWPLLVYGAGAAGVNAAMHAAARRIDVTLIEKGNRLFSTTAGAWWRRIDPTEYDWPHTHWKESRFPLEGTIPLPQPKAMSGVSLAAFWRTSWKRFSNVKGRRRYGDVTLLRNLNASCLTVHDRGGAHMVDVTGSWPSAATDGPLRRFGAVLSCVGFGDEVVTEEPRNGLWSDYAGPDFWKDHDSIDPDPRVSLPSNISNVVISGGGDGAMQDFQRVATSLFGRELLERIEILMQQLNGEPIPAAGRDFLDSVYLGLLSADESARRTSSWANERYGAPRTLERLNNAFNSGIEKIIQYWGSQFWLLIAEEIFREEMRIPERLKLTWVMRDRGPGMGYPLNRYLSLLLARLASMLPATAIDVRHGGSIHAIKPDGHRCGNAGACIGQPHEVTLASADGSYKTIPTADLIIIRHGIEPRPLLLGGRGPVPEQISPFDLPA